LTLGPDYSQTLQWAAIFLFITPERSMESPWKSKYKGGVGGRPVEAEVHDEGGYRVRTTQGEDAEGEVASDAGSITIIPPTERGRVIDIEGETKEEVRDQLVEAGFSDAEADEIIRRLEASQETPSK
jgi:hypothetical protein